MEIHNEQHARELADAFEEIYDVWPFVDKLPRINSNWKVYEERTEEERGAWKVDFPEVSHRLVVETDGETVLTYFEEMKDK